MIQGAENLKVEIRGKLLKHPFGLQPKVVEYLRIHCFAVVEEELLNVEEYSYWLNLYCVNALDLTITRKKLMLPMFTNVKLMKMREDLNMDLIIKDGYIEVKQ